MANYSYSTGTATWFVLRNGQTDLVHMHSPGIAEAHQVGGQLHAPYFIRRDNLCVADHTYDWVIYATTPMISKLKVGPVKTIRHTDIAPAHMWCIMQGKANG